MKIKLINFLISLKNATILNFKFVSVVYNYHILKLLKCLYQEGLILSFQIFKVNKKNFLKIFLKSIIPLNFFENLKIMSTLSFTYYIKYLDLCKLHQKHKIIIISTSKGYLTSTQCKLKKCGGKLLFLS